MAYDRRQFTHTSYDVPNILIMHRPDRVPGKTVCCVLWLICCQSNKLRT